MNEDLLPIIAAPENLLSAWRSVRGNIPRYRRLRSAGPDGITIQEFERDLPAHLNALRHALLSGRYTPGQAARHALPKASGGQRQIVVLNVVDRVAQRAVQQVLEPLWEPHFLPCSYGFRPGRSLHQAVELAQTQRRSGAGWVVDGDIEKCFDSFDQSLLAHRLTTVVEDRRVIRLLRVWMESGAVLQGNPKPNEPPQQEWLRQTQERLQRGWKWVLESISATYDPYGEREDWAWDEHPSENGADMPNPVVEQRERLVRKQAIRQLAQSALIAGASFIRPALATAGKALVTTVSSPLGRRLVGRSLLFGGGAAGVAVGAGIAAYLLYRQLSPASMGIIQGSPLSPLLSNIYLHPFDEQMCQHDYNLLRFADDWVILCQTQEQAELAYNESVRALGRLRLRVNRQKTRILSPAEPLQWLGVTIPGKRG